MAAVSSNGGATQTIPVQSDPTLMGNAINWFRDPNTSLLLKIGAVALYTLATLAAGYLLGDMVLTFSAVTITLLAGALKELSSQIGQTPASQNPTGSTAPVDVSALHTQIREVERDLAFMQIKELVGGTARFNVLNRFEGPVEKSPSGAIHIEPTDMPNPTMRGQDEGRHFVAFKIRLNGTMGSDDRALVCYQKQPNGKDWASTLTRQKLNFEDEARVEENPHDKEFNIESLTLPGGLELFRQIIAYNHPTYELIP